LQPSGTDGTFLIQDNHYNSLVIKAAPSPCYQYFASAVLSKLGIRCPRMIVKSRDDVAYFK